MTKVTRFGWPIPRLAARLGYDPTIPTGDVPPPVDLALAAIIEVVPTPDPVAVTVVQSAHGWGNGGGISIKLPVTPTLGNTLIFAINQRNAIALDMTSTYGPAMPTWTVVANLYGEIAVLVKTADGVHDHNPYPDDVNEYLVKSPVANGGWFWAMWEVSGLDIATLVSATATGSGSSMSVPIVPAAGAEAFEVGAFEIRAGDVAVFAPGFYGTAGSGWTEDYASPASTYHPGALFEHRTVTAPNGSDSHPATGDRYEAAGANWHGVALAMNPLATAPTTWELAPEIHDGDDATYHEADEAISGAVLRAMLDGTYRVSRCVVKLGHSAAGSKSYTLEGANLADFSDADTLDSISFTATGSYTADTITFHTPNAVAYRFLRLTGPTEARRFYTFEAYVDSSDLAAYQLRAEKGVASGYADLDASALVPIAELPTGSSSSTVALGNHGHGLGTMAAEAKTITTQDDLLVGGAAGALARLAKGTDGQVLTVDPSTHHLVWATPTGGSALTVEEADGSPTDAAVTKIVFPNGTLAITAHVATYTPSAGAGITQAYVGYNTIGASWEATTSTKVYAKKITLANDCLLTAIEAYVRSRNGISETVQSLSIAVYTDSSGTPALLRAYIMPASQSVLLDAVSGTGSGADVGRWLSIPLGAWLTAGDYWIAVKGSNVSSANLELAYDGSGSDRTYTSGGNWFTDWGFYTPTTGSNKYSIRANTIR